MPLPDGVPTITVVDNRRRPDGSAMTGQIIFRPRVRTLTSAEHGVIVMGDAVASWVNGILSVALLPNDAAGFTPTGGTYEVIERPYGAAGDSYDISLTSALGPTVQLSDLAPASPAQGEYVTVPGPQGPAGPTGPQGPAGATGATGLQGPAGADGDNADAEAYTDAAIAAEVARANAAYETPAGATAKVTAHKDAIDPHGDRAWADTKFATQASLSDLDGFVNDALTRVSAIEGGTAWLAGLQIAGNAIISGGDLTVSDFAKGYRLRRGGSGLDFEATGADLILSNWSGTGFNGTQRNYLRFSSDAQNLQVAGKVEFADGLYGTTRHVLDGSANTVGLYGATPVTQQTVTGSRVDGTALASLLTALGLTGAIVNSSTAGIAAPWRRRHLPDPVVVDSLYAGSAPSIGTAQTGTPTATYVKYAPAGVTLSGSDVTGPFTYLGAGGVQVGTGTPDSTYVLPTSRYPNTRTNLSSSQAVWTVEFGTDAQIFQLRFNYQTAGMYRLSIDGRKVTDLMQAVGGTTAGSTHLMTVDLGSAAPRVIRFDFYTVPFGGVFLPPGATMWSTVPNGGRFMVFGDSLSDGSAINTGGGAGTWAHRTGRLLGSNDVWDEARGGTGYVTAGSYATLANRVATDVVAWSPSRLVVWAGYNDNGGSQPAISTAAASLYSTIRSGLPACEVYVIGCWSPTGSPGASITNTDATLRAAAAAAGYPFISPITGAIYDSTGALVTTHGAWITGTGRVGATTGTGNADVYIGTDAVHPTDAGHVYLSRRIAAAIRELMPA